MYVRLWWKDARQFWPIWLFLALAAAVVQGLLLHYLGKDVRNGQLGLSALICASLYAFATGAAAFAGERETGTLRLLDTLPVDRRVVWVGKASFALVTTLALALTLLAMAAMSTDQWRKDGPLSVWEAYGFGLIVFVALGWGLFWSAILSNALTAAVTAICCTGVSLSVVSAGLDHAYLNQENPFGFVIAQLLIILATLIASVAIFARSVRWKRLHLEFRSPIVINLADSTSQRRARLQIQSPVATMLTTRPAVGIHEGLAIDHPLRRSWIVEARHLAWQTMKEGRKTWGLLTASALVLAFLIFVRVGYSPISEWLLLMSTGIALVAGASVFGLENRARTQRFLTHHGARPGLVWLVKLAVWGMGLGAVWSTLAVIAFMNVPWERRGVGPIDQWLSAILVVPLFFGVAQLCGMAIRRGITAVVIAMVIGLVLTIPLTAMQLVQMLPLLGLLVIPVGLLAVSWAWSGDWLFDRPAPGRWLRLGLLLTGMFTLVVSWYAGYRAWSIRDVGPIAPPAVWLEATAKTLPTDQNAAELYDEARRQMVGPLDSPELLGRNQKVLDLLRRAASRPNCRFMQREKPTLLDQPDLPPVAIFARLMSLDSYDRQNHGDLAGAWDDIMVLFRMARHVGDGTGLISAFANVVLVERSALGHALEWAVAPGQTPERLQAALAAYRDLPNMPSSADIVRVDANLVENTLDLPTDRLRDWLNDMNGTPPSQRVFTSVLLDAATTPWERVRIRRVNRLTSQAWIQDAMREPWQRSRLVDPEIEHAQVTTQTVMRLIPQRGYVFAVDQNEVARRALVQILALRMWQLRHNGHFPESLEALVPDTLSSLPIDPYSGKPFGFKRSNGQEVSPLREVLTAAPGKGHAAAPGSWLLYSVGPDGVDNGGFTFKPNDPTPQPMDIVFAIPPVETGDAGATKGPDRGHDAAKDRPSVQP
jgi:hypothetical protein